MVLNMSSALYEELGDPRVGDKIANEFTATSCHPGTMLLAAKAVSGSSHQHQSQPLGASHIALARHTLKQRDAFTSMRFCPDDVGFGCPKNAWARRNELWPHAAGF
jgi:hypothetical protein